MQFVDRVRAVLEGDWDDEPSLRSDLAAHSGDGTLVTALLATLDRAKRDKNKGGPQVLFSSILCCVITFGFPPSSGFSW